MKKKMLNNTHIEGRLYEHKLENKLSGPDSKNPGTAYIGGSIDIATDDAGLNIVSVNFTYSTPKFNSGKDNPTYAILQNIIDGKVKSVMADGADEASTIRVDSALGLNEWYVQDDQLISIKRNEGGFVHVNETLNADEGKRNIFECDMLITSFRRIEADEENETPEKGIVKGAIFNFRNELLPVEFSIFNPNGMDFFEGLNASNAEPIFTKVWGHQLSNTTIVKTVEENAFGGEANVTETKRTKKDFVISGTSVDPYDWDTEETLLASELKDKIAERETKLATLLADAKKRQASNGGTATTGTPKAGGYDF